ncbi:hypothetical protein D3C76_1335880 [compost metagenome]
MTTKIVMTGTAPKFDQAVLKQRQEGFHNMYKQTSQCMELVRANIPYEFLTAVVEKSKLGYVLSEWSPISTSPADYSAYMIKPEELQQVDLIAIDEREKCKYIAELEKEREEYRVKLTHQLLQTRELQEAKKAADKHAKVLAEIEKEVNDTFGVLIVPE